MIYDQVSEVVIHLSGAALRKARRETRRGKGLRGWLRSFRFTGPHFRATDKTDIYVSIGAATVNVGCHTDGEACEYIYPLATVGRIKTVAL